jgi:hypothetical protein
MRGPKPSSPIPLTGAEAKEREQLRRAHPTPHALTLRARIMLRAHAHPEQRKQQLASAFGTTDRTVRTWRGRWVKTHSLADAPRSGAPRRFSPSGARARHGSRVSLAHTGTGAALAWESGRMSPARRPRSQPACHLDQSHRSLAQSRTPSPLALSCLATHS